MATKKVLLISIFHPELLRGGSQQVCYELFCGLADDGEFTPILLASVDQSNPALFKAGAVITGFDGRPNEFLFLSQSYDFWWHRVCDPRAIDRFAEFLLETEPDVVHFHHFLLFGIDLLSLTREVLPRATIIITFHEFLSLCAADGQMVRTGTKALCDRPSSVRCHQCFPDRAPEEFTLRRMWFQRHLAVVDYFVCPSHFMIDRYVKWGLPAAKIHLVPNGQRDYAAVGGLRPPAVAAADRRRNRFGFFGQLLDNKGILVLFQAVTVLRQEGFTDFVVEINGDNLKYSHAEHRQELESFLAEENARPLEERIVRFNGGYDVEHLPQRMARIDWCVVPSIWWEIFVLVISEAWMFGRPVICSNIGAMAERVTDGVDGLHFNVGDPRALADVMRRACTEPQLWDRLAKGIRSPPAREAMVAGYKRLYNDQIADANAAVGFIGEE